MDVQAAPIIGARLRSLGRTSDQFYNMETNVIGAADTSDWSDDGTMKSSKSIPNSHQGSFKSSRGGVNAAPLVLFVLGNTCASRVGFGASSNQGRLLYASKSAMPKKA